MRYSIRSLMMATTVVALGISALMHCLGPVRPETVVAQIQSGMSRDDVRQVLGFPNGDRSSQSWSYERTFNPGWLVVYFDANGKVTYVDHEPVFP